MFPALWKQYLVRDVPAVLQGDHALPKLAIISLVTNRIGRKCLRFGAWQTDDNHGNER